MTVRPRVLDVVFSGRDDFLAQEAHVARGCLLVPVPDPAPQPLADLVLRVETPTRGGGRFPARVIQILPGLGVALALEDPAARGRFAEWFAAARSGPPSAGETRVAWEAAESAKPAPPEPAAADRARESRSAPEPAVDAGEGKEAGLLSEQIRAMSATERMQLARHGDRPARQLLMKDTNKTIQLFILQNPHLTLDEVRWMAGNRQGHAEVLQQIGGREEWAREPGIATALVRNPRTPPGVAVRLLDRLPLQELRRLARSDDVVRAVQLAARKKVQEAG